MWRILTVNLSGLVTGTRLYCVYSFRSTRGEFNESPRGAPVNGAVEASAGARLRAALAVERPLQVVGAINAYTARLAAASGFKALYLSGGGVAANSLGLPDLGISTMDDVLIDVRRITDACALPLLVDADTGWGGAFNIARTVKSFAKFGAAGLHIEDQVQAKRCGHRPGKEIVSKEEMVDRVKAAVDARPDDQFVIMARTDALAGEGIDKALERAVACVEAGADMVFPEAVTDLPTYRRFKDAVKVPILANITEFGQTPLFTREELGAVGVDLVLHCCSAYRAMNAAALATYEAIRRDGTQKNVVGTMQTRADLYRYLDYHAYEEKLDRLFAAGKEK
ncbi:MAG: methylisocitrate lyase [Gammaproteobacteria bacterium]|nr:methylisocitrate lyase [Gammaproteobacteria bacterium]